MGKFVITKKANGSFQFNLKSNNGLVILTSEAYATKPDCESGIESVRRFSQEDGQFERKASSNSRCFFTLMANNGQVIGTSQLYVNQFACDKGIASVKSNAHDAPVEDKSGNRKVPVFSV